MTKDEFLKSVIDLGIDINQLEDQERQNISQKINECNCNINDLNHKLNCHKNNIDKLQNDLDNSNALNCKLQNTKIDYERQLDNFHNENEKLKCNLMNERALRNDEEKKNRELDDVIKDRDRKIAQLNREVEEIKMTQEQVSDDNDAYQVDNQNLRNHINVLTNQNKKLICELENVLGQDEDMKRKFARKDNTALLIRNSQNCLGQSVNSLEDCLSANSGCCQPGAHFRSNSYEYED